MAEEGVQRRLAAIQAADVVGYSRLMEIDEAGTLAQMKALRRELLDPGFVEHHGRVFKTTGDGILSEFPSAVDAVEHAVAIQRAMATRNIGAREDQKILIRIGINLGDVIFDDGDVFGDGVNVAARLEGLADPGGICISGAVFEQISNKTEFLFENVGQQSVKNIDRPIQVYRVLIDDTVAGDNKPDEIQISSILSRPAIAVLPFENMSGDPQQEYFADGLTEDLINVLSSWRSFPVIARNSTFAYKGKAVKIQKIAEELGARYVMEGSVRAGGKRVRVVTQLIDAESGHHIWSERYDREIEDIFELQDEITSAIANIIEPELSRVENRRIATRQPMSLDAWGCYQRGLGLLYENTKEGTAQARIMFERAIEIDPSYAQAYTGLAYSYHRDIFFGFGDDLKQSKEKYGHAIRRALALDDKDSFAHGIYALYSQLEKKSDQAIAAADKSVERNPSNSTSYITKGMVLTFNERPDEAISLIHRGIQLNPSDARNFIFYGHLADAYLGASRFEEAVDWARKSTFSNPNYLGAHLLLAASLGYIGKTEDARLALDRCFEIDPNFMDRSYGWKSYRSATNIALIRTGLQKAGMSE